MTIEPVSYTHLDVYKRQDAMYTFITQGVDELTKKCIMYATEAVSYTHLDVYKRQVQKTYSV